MKYTERSLILLAFLCSTATADIFGVQPPFEPVIHPDGSRTWKIQTPLKHLKYVPKQYRETPASRDEWIAGSHIAHHKFCDAWEITSSRQDTKMLIIEGRCK